LLQNGSVNIFNADVAILDWYEESCRSTHFQVATRYLLNGIGIVPTSQVGAVTFFILFMAGNYSL
jgi:hypothetical protein